MAIDIEVNKILKEMWRLDEMLVTGGSLSPAEKDFYNTNLSIIINYYNQNNQYWKDKTALS